MIDAFQREGLGVILDIVPNHMGVGGADNPFWLDVLEWGPESRYAGWFDIDWARRRRQAARARARRAIRRGAEARPTRASLRRRRNLRRLGLWRPQAAGLPAHLSDDPRSRQRGARPDCRIGFSTCRTGGRRSPNGPRASRLNWRSSRERPARRAAKLMSGSLRSTGTGAKWTG